MEKDESLFPTFVALFVSNFERVRANANDFPAFRPFFFLFVFLLG